MGVYIKDMQMPTDCELCPFEKYGYCHAMYDYIAVESGRDTACPLVEIPTPHGRLIDEGLYWDILENSFDTDPRFNSDTEIIRCYREAWDITPTVIEAEE